MKTRSVIRTSSHGCEWAAKNVALHLKGFGCVMAKEAESCDLKIMVGYYQRDREQPELMKAKKRVVWWVGTDILWMERPMGVKKIELIRWLNENVDEHWAEWEHSAARLRALGLDNVKVVHMPTRRRYEPLALPQRFTVGVYCYNSRQEFYGYSTVQQAAALTPSIQWLLYPRYKAAVEGNVEHVQRTAPDAMEALYKRMSVHARIVDADGMPQGPMEAAMCGRPVIYNYRQMEHCIWVSPATPETLAERVRDLRDKQGRGEGYNLAGSEHWRAVNDPSRLVQEVERML